MPRLLKVSSLLAFTSITRGNFGVILLTILILTLVGMNLIFVPSLLNGLVSGANQKLINTYVGDIVVQQSDGNGIRNTQNLMDRISALDGVTGVTARSSMGAQLEYKNNTDNIDNKVSCTVNGIDPKSDNTVFSINKWLIEGSYLSPGDRNSIVLGVQLAGADRPDIEFYSRSLEHVHVGDTIKVKYANGIEKQYHVKGIFYTQFIQTDLQAFVSQTEFLSINGFSRDRADTINVKTAPGADINAIRDEIAAMRTDIKVLNWTEYAGIVRSMTDSFKVIQAILNIVNLLVAGITVFIVTYIDVTNRRKQIGIQRAIGIIPFSIVLAYVFRAIFYSVIGIGLAIVLFRSAITPLEMRYPFHFPFGAVYLVAGPREMITTAAMLLAVALISTLLPIRGVLRTKIIDAIWS